MLTYVPYPSSIVIGQAWRCGDAQAHSLPCARNGQVLCGDRLEVLDGDGNLGAPLYRGPVAPLLCGAEGCG